MVTDPVKVFSRDLGGVTNSSSPLLGSFRTDVVIHISSSGVSLHVCIYACGQPNGHNMPLVHPVALNKQDHES